MDEHDGWRRALSRRKVDIDSSRPYASRSDFWDLEDRAEILRLHLSFTGQ
jgi:hypothetical protein